MNFYKPILYVLLLALMCVIAAPATVFAHKVTVFAWVEGDKVYTESKFSGGRVVKGGLIEIFNETGEKLLEGKTNDSGEYSFNPPQKTTLIVKLTAGMGHQAQWKIQKDEFGIDDSKTETSAVQDSTEPAVEDEIKADVQKKGSRIRRNF